MCAIPNLDLRINYEENQESSVKELVNLETVKVVLDQDDIES